MAFGGSKQLNQLVFLPIGGGAGLPDANNIAQYQYNHAREHNPDVNLAAQTHGIFYGYQDLSADLS